MDEASRSFIAKCGDCLREVEETGYWLELLVEAKIVPQAKLDAVRQECRELTDFCFFPFAFLLSEIRLQSSALLGSP